MDMGYDLKLVDKLYLIQVEKSSQNQVKICENSELQHKKCLQSMRNWVHKNGYTVNILK